MYPHFIDSIYILIIFTKYIYQGENYFLNLFILVSMDTVQECLEF